MWCPSVRRLGSVLGCWGLAASRLLKEHRARPTPAALRGKSALTGNVLPRAQSPGQTQEKGRAPAAAKEPEVEVSEAERDQAEAGEQLNPTAALRYPMEEPPKRTVSTVWTTMQTENLTALTKIAAARYAEQRSACATPKKSVRPRWAMSKACALPTLLRLPRPNVGQP